MTCLSSIKFNMVATVVRNYEDNVFDPNEIGGFKEVYDELTGEVTPVFVQTDMVPDDKKDQVTVSMPCLVSPSYTVTQANNLDYGKRVVDTERLIMKVPSRYHIYTTDRVTSIRNRTGELIYEDDQNPKVDEFDQRTPAIYNVVGVLPVTDPFGNVIERQVQLEKWNG